MRFGGLLMAAISIRVEAEVEEAGRHFENPFGNQPATLRRYFSLRSEVALLPS
jgi:hypothetical protein